MKLCRAVNITASVPQIEVILSSNSQVAVLAGDKTTAPSCFKSSFQDKEENQPAKKKKIRLRMLPTPRQLAINLRAKRKELSTEDSEQKNLS